MSDTVGRLPAQVPAGVARPTEWSGVLRRIALAAIAAPRRLLVIAVFVAAAAGIFGVPVAKSLCACGFEDPSSESARAKELLSEKFGAGDVQLVLVVTAPGGADSDAAR